MKIGLFFKLYNIIQLLTIEDVDMMYYRPENTNIDRGEAEVNIGILWSISHHIQCLDSQQLFYYITFLHTLPIYPSSKVQGYVYIERQITGRTSVTIFSAVRTPF